MASARVRNEWRTALEQLHERMLAIAPREFSAQDNPLDPGRIAQTFLGACEQLEADMKCLQLLCRQFDVHVLGHLDGFYRNSNQVLIDARVLPELAAVHARQRQTTAAGAALAAAVVSAICRPRQHPDRYRGPG